MVMELLLCLQGQALVYGQRAWSSNGHSPGWPRFGSARTVSSIFAVLGGLCQAVQAVQGACVRRFSGSQVQAMLFISEHAMTRAVEVRLTR